MIKNRQGHIESGKNSLAAQTPKIDTNGAVKNESDGYPSSRGMVLLRKYRNGEKLTARQAILATCCECMGYYVDGRRNCEVDACPLYRWMPYKKTITA